MTRVPGRVLGVDLGERRIGLAVSDPTGTLASPHTVLTRSGDRGHDHRAILAVAAELGAGRVVVGLPRSLSGRLGPAAKGVLEEADALRRSAGAAGPQVDLHDERFTTVIARRSRRDQRPAGSPGAGGRAERRNGGRAGRGGRATATRPVDDAAAAVMLQSYLDGHRSGAGGHGDGPGGGVGG